MKLNFFSGIWSGWTWLLTATVAFLSVGAFQARADYPTELLATREIQAEMGLGELEGQLLDISGDTLAVSELYNERVQVFVKDGTNWSLQATITSPDGAFGFAQSVAVDGDTLAVGSPFSRTVYMFGREGTEWVPHEVIEAADEFFGAELDVSGDTLAVGAPAVGSTFIYVRDGTNWPQQARLFTGRRDREGAVAVDGDLVVMGNWNRTLRGATFVYERTGTNWMEVPVLSNGSYSGSSMSRRDVAVSGNIIAVTDNIRSNAGVFSGHVYTYERIDGTWLPRAPIANAGAASNFGRYVALDGNLMLVSGNSFDGPRAAYLYEIVGTNWLSVTTLVPPAPYPNMEFGNFVALEGQILVVGDLNSPVFVFEPEYTNPSAVAGFVRKFLYPADAQSSPTFDAEAAAFRYKSRLYGEDDQGVRARFELMSQLYGADERERSMTAEAQLLLGLAENPDSAVLRNLLLEIYYDRTVAEAIYTKSHLADAELARIGPPLSPFPQGGEFLIDNEIAAYEQVLATNRFALQDYFGLLGDDFGGTSDPPLGYQIFRDLVPGRALMPATYTNIMGQELPVVPEAMLFSGHKDTVLLFDLLRDYGRVAETIGRLLFSRNDMGDLDVARDLVGQSQQFLYLHGNLLRDIFDVLPDEEDPSSLAQAIAGWEGAMTSLVELRTALNGRTNPLGYDPDFLMFADRVTIDGTNYFDSFDSFAAQLNPASSTSPLFVALDDLQGAIDDYTAYRGYQDQLLEQIDESTDAYQDRLVQIVGAEFGGPGYSDNPTNNPGSELDQQYRSINLARLRIEKNKTEIRNLEQAVQIEINRAADVSGVYVKYGNKRAKLAEKMAHINAAQAGANALADALSVEKLTTGLFVGFVANAAVQAGAEELKGQIEAEKEKLAGLEQAEIEGLNSAATVKTMLLQMNTLALDSQEAAILLQQEVARMAALYREKQWVENKLEERNRNLSTRYFADPIHRITSETNLIQSAFSFEHAQKWVFFMSRAFFYKWNTPFTNTFPQGRHWNAQSVFKVRNAQELNDLYLALVDKNRTIGQGLNRDDALTAFSMRKDFLGFVDGRTYTDPITLETLAPQEAFRRKLAAMVVTNLSDLRLEIDFSTVREKDGSSFFLGPRFGLDGSVVSPGRYLDKIDWLKIKITGDHSTGFTQANGDLTYGGTSFIRRQNVGHIDPDRPDRVRGEMTAFSTRFWFFDTGLDRYRFNEGFLSSGVQIELSPDPEVPPSVSQINDFVERSVAASNWHLSVPIRNTQSGTDLVRIDEIDDILIYFFHRSVSRPQPIN